MDAVPLVVSVGRILQDVVQSPIIIQGNISVDKLRKPRWDVLKTVISLSQFLLSTFFRMRAQAIVEAPPTIPVQEIEGRMIPLMDVEIQHCAAVIAAAFLNPSKQN